MLFKQRYSKLLIIFAFISLGVFMILWFVRSEYSSNSKMSTSFDALEANQSLKDEVQETVAIIDSHTTTRRGSSYKLHILVDKNTTFVPLAIQIGGTGAREPFETLNLKYETNINCLRFASPSPEDPYGRYLNGELTGYETEWTAIENSYLTEIKSGMFTLFVRSGKNVFFVESLKIDGECTWITE